MAASDHMGRQWWHGSPSGELVGGSTGLHLGTREAARQALNARIGTPLEGDWDGSREYGKTLLRGRADFASAGETPTGHNYRAIRDGHGESAYLPSPDNAPTYADRTKVSMTSRPNITAYDIVGPMSNTPHSPHEDFKANGYMSAQIKKGTARRGYYYKNEGEDVGSISAVVPPGGALLRRPKAIVDAATAMLGGRL